MTPEQLLLKYVKCFCDQGLNDSLFPKILCDGKVGSGLALVWWQCVCHTNWLSAAPQPSLPATGLDILDILPFATLESS